MSNDRKERVFLSYASEDLDMVRKVYDGLINRGLDVWFDKEDLGPGNWKPQITRAITKSRYFIVCLSNAAIRKTGDKPGFQDEELNGAYEIARNQSEQEFSIIPARIEDCSRGDHRLSVQQQYDLFEDIDQGLDKLAVDLGGISLSDDTAKDERSDDKKFIDGLYARAISEFYAGRFNESIKLLDAVLALSSDYVSAWINKVTALGSLGRFEEAIEACDKALQIDPNNVSVWVNKGSALGSLGRIGEAVNAFDKALQINPNDGLTWYNMGYALDILGRYEEAIKAFDKTLEIKPDYVPAWDKKGVAFARLSRYGEAVETFDKALEINPEDANVWYNKGLALFHLSKDDEALAAFDKALEINPNDPGALKYRDQLMKQTKGKG